MDETKELKEPLRKFKNFVVFYDDNNTVAHMVGYENKITVGSLKHNFRELVEDKEFDTGLTPEQIDLLGVDIVDQETVIGLMDTGT